MKVTIYRFLDRRQMLVAVAGRFSVENQEALRNLRASFKKKLGSDYAGSVSRRVLKS